MTEVRVSTGLRGQRLWRYLSLDKLIDLLSTGELFFAPLACFVESDPFEGYLPAVAMEAHAGIFGTVIQHFETLVSQMEHLNYETGPFRRKLDDLKAAPARFFQAINQSIAINCWHKSDYESEAMWRLYADNGKAVAIETDVDALRKSMESRQSEHLVHIYSVEYVDFFDAKLKPTDCVVEGHLTPLLKRKSYQHESEVRAFIGRRLPTVLREALNVDYWEPAPVRLPVDVRVLVKRVWISPYAKQPFQSSVSKICGLLGLSADVVTSSKLLSGHEELLKAFSY